MILTGTHISLNHTDTHTRGKGIFGVFIVSISIDVEGKLMKNKVFLRKDQETKYSSIRINQNIILKI